MFVKEVNKMKFISITEFAKETGISYSMVWRLIRGGQIKARRLHERGFWMIEADQIAEWKGKLA